MIKMANYIYCHLDLLEIFMYWALNIISEGLTFYMALENLRAGQVTPVPPSSGDPELYTYVFSLVMRKKENKY